MKILLAEDDRTIASGLEYSLKQEGFETVLCHNASSATEVITHKIEEIDLCIFDLNLPDGSGYDLCELVKKRRDIPVIFLTAYDDEVNVVMGLDMGADDYITKPFRIRELVSRIKSVHRRYDRHTQPKNTIAIGNIQINTLE
jgi:DNA-binding response OmpR family regulator